MKTLFLTAILALSFSQNVCIAQAHCGTKDRDIDEWIADMNAHGGRPQVGRQIQNRAPFVVPIHYHIVRRSNKSDGFPLHWLMEMHCDLNKNYAQNNTGFQFTLDTISYINSDNLFQITSLTEEATLNTLNTPEHCNVYLVDDPQGACGYTYRYGYNNNPTRRAGIYLQASKLNINCTEPGSTTLTHEMGHWLDLPHTFFGWEGRTYGQAGAPSNGQRENVARTGTGANCATRGDGFCDTEPDYVSGRWTCPNNTNFIDPLGVSFKLNPTNYMCYALDNCVNKFSPQQIAQMNNYVGQARDRVDIVSQSLPSLGEVDSLRVIFPRGLVNSADNSRIRRDDAVIRFPRVEGASHYIISLGSSSSFNSNFVMSNTSILYDTLTRDTFFRIPNSILGTNVPNNTYYYYQIRAINAASVCGDNLRRVQAFRVTNSNVQLVTKDASCPGNSDGEILVKDSLLATVNFVKLNGDSSVKKLYEGLPAGFYNVEVKLSSNETVLLNTSINEPQAIAGTVALQGNTGAKINPTGGTAPYTYTWSNGRDKQTETNLAKGTYTVTVIDSKGCESNPITVKIAGNTVSLASASQDGLKIYPTKIHKGDKLNLSQQIVSGQMDIIDIQGRLIKQYSLQNTDHIIWPVTETGIYFVNLQIGQESSTHKVESY